MPETPEQLYERVAACLRMPPVQDWDTFPFDGEMRPPAPRPPVETEPARGGAGGVDCRTCVKPDADLLWTSFAAIWDDVIPPLPEESGDPTWTTSETACETGSEGIL